MKRFDVLVVGGGHAGCEAAAAAARLGADVCLVTFAERDLGALSCNPAIGGVGKGHLVREIDALDGLIGRVGDYAGIQFRLLNRSRGPAVRGPRAQADRDLYQEGMQRAISSIENITRVYGEVTALLIEGTRVVGAGLKDGSRIDARTVILTAGTFLRGVIHVGDEKIEAGRMGDSASRRLGQMLSDLLPSRGRLKTGTPPRLLARSINWDAVDNQWGDAEPEMLSFLSREPVQRQVACGVTQTNSRTHAIIRENLDRSAMYGGRIEGVGPRYCPSIEDKVVRFPDKDAHQIFLEPEGLNSDRIYPNGISTSLPAEIQEAYVRSIKGLEDAEIVQTGYAIEYDFFDPRQLDRNLAVRGLRGLYLAGQVNGTTGYEEAAAQGLVAGLAAGCEARGMEAPEFRRTDSYIGVLLDDLTTRGVTEPYRMFTSRAEFRLHLRIDNADARLTPMGIALGCVGERRARAFEAKETEKGALRAQLFSVRLTPGRLREIGANLRDDSGSRTAFEALALPGIDAGQLFEAAGAVFAPTDGVCQSVLADGVYAHYLDRQREAAARLNQEENRRIPPDIDFSEIEGLSFEIREKLECIRPETIGQAARIEGMTPSALLLLVAALRRRRADQRGAA